MPSQNKCDYSLTGESIITSLRAMSRSWCYSHCGRESCDDCHITDKTKDIYWDSTAFRKGLYCPTIRAVEYAIAIVEYFLALPQKGYRNIGWSLAGWLHRFTQYCAYSDSRVDKDEYDGLRQYLLEQYGIEDQKKWAFRGMNNDENETEEDEE